MRSAFAVLALAAAIAVPAAAYADTYNFTYTINHDYTDGFAGAQVVETFSLPSTPTESNIQAGYPDATEGSFDVDNVSVVINGNPTTDTLTFYTVECQENLDEPCEGGIPPYSIYSADIGGGYAYPSPQQYTTRFGQYDVTFALGTFELSNPGDDSPADDQTLTIVDASLQTAATPEPSSFVLLGSGILGVAGAARRRVLGE